MIPMNNWATQAVKKLTDEKGKVAGSMKKAALALIEELRKGWA